MNTNRSREYILLGLLLAVYAVASWLSLDWFPVSVDEPGYTDPAASYVLGQGFTSGAWYAQGYEGFWAGNVPLHQLLLIPWIHCFGFSLVAVRSINILYTVLGSLCLWSGLKRSGALNRSTSRLAVLLLLLGSHAGGIWINLGRPDAICFFLASFIFFLFTVRGTPLRYLGLIIAAFASLWASIALALVIGLTGMILLVAKKGKYLKEVASLAAGGVLGVVALAALYQSQHVLTDFINSLAPHSHLIPKPAHIVAPTVTALKHRLGAYTDYTFLALIGATAATWLACGMGKRNLPWIMLGLISLVVLPAMLFVSGVFPIYYAWYAFVPTLVSLFALRESSERNLMLPRLAATIALACILLLGHPRVWFMGFLYRHDQSNEKIDNWLADVLHKNDVAFIEQQGWYKAKVTANQIYQGHRAPNLTPAEEQSLTVFIATPEFFHAQRTMIKGDWHEEPAQHIAVPNRNTHRLPFSQWYRDHPTVDLHVYRRGAGPA